MENNTYMNYLISNLISFNNYINDFGMSEDKEIEKKLSNIANEMNGIMEIMKKRGIKIDTVITESQDCKKEIRDFKIKEILN